MILNPDRFHLLCAVILLLSSTRLFCASAVIPENTKPKSFSPEVGNRGQEALGQHTEPRTIMMTTMSRLMEYFRNADIFATIRTMLDSGSGVKKEWVPLGSLMFSNPLGQKRS